MEPVVRPARPDDRAAPGLLYLSAAPYYDAYTGSPARAVRILRALWERPGHTASVELTTVAELGGEVVGAMVAFPAPEGDRLARRFLALSIVRVPAWRWPRIARHLRASVDLTPAPPDDTLYVDALAVDDRARRRGVASALLAEAERRAAQLDLAGVALDTGLQNTGAQALYEAYGFERGGERHARDERMARIVGGPGFVSYFKPAGPARPAAAR
jgi:ribosomal protein S18 acetylase RimI-like enzyme